MTDLPDDRPRLRSRVAFGSLGIELRRPSGGPWTAYVHGGRWSSHGYGESPLAAIGAALQSLGGIFADTEAIGAHAISSLRAAVGEVLSSELGGSDRALARYVHRGAHEDARRLPRLHQDEAMMSVCRAVDDLCVDRNERSHPNDYQRAWLMNAINQGLQNAQWFGSTFHAWAPFVYKSPLARVCAPGAEAHAKIPACPQVREFCRTIPPWERS